MRALLADLDRTMTGPDLALDPSVPGRLQELRDAGVHVIVVTGRGLGHVLASSLRDHASAIVAENGAVVWRPGRGADLLADPAFIGRVRAALGPLAAQFHWGQAMGSGPRFLAPEVTRVLGGADVPHTIAFNAEEAMVLPPATDKGTGARVALTLLGVGPESATAIGDGDNDVPLFHVAGHAVAVANASESARAAARETTRASFSEGFLEFTARALAATGSGGAAREPVA